MVRNRLRLTQEYMHSDGERIEDLQVLLGHDSVAMSPSLRGQVARQRAEGPDIFTRRKLNVQLWVSDFSDAGAKNDRRGARDARFVRLPLIPCQYLASGANASAGHCGFGDQPTQGSPRRDCQLLRWVSAEHASGRPACRGQPCPCNGSRRIDRCSTRSLQDHANGS